MYRIIGADGKEYGPVTAEQLRQWITEGRANADTRVLPEGMSDWKRAADIPEFSLLFMAAGSRHIPVSASFPSAPRTNGLATTSLVMGIIAMTFGLCCCYGLPFNVLGIIFALVAIGQINDNPHLYEGKGVAIAGLVICLLSLALAILMVMVFGAMSVLDQGHRVYRL